MIYRPLVQYGALRPRGAVPLAGGWGWFETVELLSRTQPSQILRAQEVPAETLDLLSRPRAPMAGLSLDQPRLMGILNVTPDSFSDGGEFTALANAVQHANTMVVDGADIVDVGGESTRPGAEFVPIDEEIRRTAPVIADLVQALDVPVSIDTRKHQVAHAAVAAGALIINDVAALSFDPQMLETVQETGVSICLMHAAGNPDTMQNDPSYDNVVLDVYDYLQDRVALALSAGIPRDRIMVDPGIGFGKTLDHNLALLKNISAFHGLGCPILLGASRKSFIGTLANVSETKQRMPGSVAVMLAAIAQGVQIVRVHDIAASKQALTLWGAVTGTKA